VSTFSIIAIPKNAPCISAYDDWCKTVYGARNIFCISVVAPEKNFGNHWTRPRTWVRLIVQPDSCVLQNKRVSGIGNFTLWCSVGEVVGRPGLDSRHEQDCVQSTVMLSQPASQCELRLKRPNRKLNSLAGRRLIVTSAFYVMQGNYHVCAFRHSHYQWSDLQHTISSCLVTRCCFVALSSSDSKAARCHGVALDTRPNANEIIVPVTRATFPAHRNLYDCTVIAVLWERCGPLISARHLCNNNNNTLLCGAESRVLLKSW
jgi:hypothetical protein